MFNNTANLLNNFKTISEQSPYLLAIQEYLTNSFAQFNRKQVPKSSTIISDMKKIHHLCSIVGYFTLPKKIKIKPFILNRDVLILQPDFKKL